MGIVQRQGLKYTLINFVGLAVSLVATIWLYPRVLAEYGLLGFLASTTALFIPFVSLGVNQISVRFYPKFAKKETGHRGFLGLLLSWILVGFGVFLIGIFFCKTLIINVLNDKEPLMRAYIGWMIPLLFFQLLANLLGQYTINFGRAAVPTFFNDFLIKISLPLGLFGVWRGWWLIETAVFGLISNYIIASIGLLFYLKKIGEWHFDRQFLKIERPLFREIIKFASFGVLINLSFLLISRLDVWMVSWLIGLQKGGVYTIAAYISNVMDVPARAIITVASPIIAHAWTTDNQLKINELYQKSSLNLLIVGVAIFGATVVSMSSLFQLMPNADQMQEGKMIILLLGTSKLFDLATGLNSYIIGYSKNYTSFIFSLLILAAASVSFNLFLIPKYGMTGAAIATTGAMIAYNLFNSGLIYQKYGMQPFSIATLKVVVAGLFSLLVAWSIPSTNWLIINILVKSGLFLGLFCGVVLWGKLSAEMTEFWEKLRLGKLW